MNFEKVKPIIYGYVSGLSKECILKDAKKFGLKVETKDTTMEEVIEEFKNMSSEEYNALYDESGGQCSMEYSDGIFKEVGDD